MCSEASKYLSMISSSTTLSAKLSEVRGLRCGRKEVLEFKNKDSRAMP